MLPDLYERWFVEWCGRASPVESRATCGQCAMLPDAPELPPEGPFDADTRCCTYHPHLAPHFVGAILERGSDGGCAIVRARIAGRVGVSPLGLGPTPQYARLPRGRGFGRERALVCPFLAEGRCSIWSHRGAACAAFHCKYDRGVFGHWFWGLQVVAFQAVERVLGRWLLTRMELDAAACDALLRAPEDEALDARAWGAWRGREEAYFREAARLVEPLSFAEVARIGGAELSGLAGAVRTAAAQMDAGPPERVRRNDAVLHQIGLPGRTRLQNQAVPFDLLEISSELAERLGRLEESATAALGLDDGLLRRLLDWQVLLPA
jgi:hypothetical protein